MSSLAPATTERRVVHLHLQETRRKHQQNMHVSPFLPAGVTGVCLQWGRLYFPRSLLAGRAETLSSWRGMAGRRAEISGEPSEGVRPQAESWESASCSWGNMLALFFSRSVVSLCEPMNCSPPGSSVHGNLQARTLQWVSHCLLQGIFLTQGSNPHLLLCRQILYHLSHQGSCLCSIEASNSLT